MKGATGQSSALQMAARLWWVPLVVVGALADRGSRARWLFTPEIVLLAASASTTGKLLSRRPRPGTCMRIVPRGQLSAAGFPSTHTTCAFAIAGWHRGSRRRRWLHLVAIGIGYLRVRRRAHYYGDVVAGAILGYGVAWQVEGVWSRFVTQRAAPPGRRADTHRAVRAPEPQRRGVKGSALEVR
jgi:membrane-associated phospholipid phosphatase